MPCSATRSATPCPAPQRSDRSPSCRPRIGTLMLFHYPSIWCHVLGDHACTFRVVPLGPRQTQLSTRWLVHKDAIEGVDYRARRDHTRFGGRPTSGSAAWSRTSIAASIHRPTEPGPYSPEDEGGVEQFVDWYCEASASTVGRRRKCAKSPERLRSMHVATRPACPGGLFGGDVVILNRYKSRRAAIRISRRRCAESPILSIVPLQQSPSRDMVDQLVAAHRQGHGLAGSFIPTHRYSSATWSAFSAGTGIAWASGILHGARRFRAFPLGEESIILTHGMDGAVLRCSTFVAIAARRSAPGTRATRSTSSVPTMHGPMPTTARCAPRA